MENPDISLKINRIPVHLLAHCSSTLSPSLPFLQRVIGIDRGGEWLLCGKNNFTHLQVQYSTRTTSNHLLDHGIVHIMQIFQQLRRQVL